MVVMLNFFQIAPFAFSWVYIDKLVEFLHENILIISKTRRVLGLLLTIEESRTTEAI